MPGIAQSMTTRAGMSLAHASSPSSPELASPTTSAPAAPSSRRRTMAHATRLSSTMINLIAGRCPAGRCANDAGGSGGWRAVELLDEPVDPSRDVVARRAHLVDGPAGGVV